MNRKMTKGMAVIAAALAMGFVASTSHAQTKVCFGAEVTRVGVTPPDTANNNSGYRLEVQGGSCAFAANTPVFLHTDLGDGGMATVLTAFSLNKPLTMRVPDPFTANSLVSTIHLDK